MKIAVRRRWETSNSIGGELYVDGTRECFTLEPSRTTPVHPGHPCIPAGSYKVILSLSPHLHYVTPEILKVPGRDAIRIHIANYPRDLLGCTAVGETYHPDFVGNSAAAFTKLMEILKTATDLSADYFDPSAP